MNTIKLIAFAAIAAALQACGGGDDPAPHCSQAASASQVSTRAFVDDSTPLIVALGFSVDSVKKQRAISAEATLTAPSSPLGATSAAGWIMLQVDGSDVASTHFELTSLPGAGARSERVTLEAAIDHAPMGVHEAQLKVSIDYQAGANAASNISGGRISVTECPSDG